LEGFINGIEFFDNNKSLVAAVGKEHRLGRWSVNKNVKNGISIIKI
jgi:ribosomal RNA-processing protein 9